jgi:hypothetical protein
MYVILNLSKYLALKIVSSCFLFLNHVILLTSVVFAVCTRLSILTWAFAVAGGKDERNCKA